MTESPGVTPSASCAAAGRQMASDVSQGGQATVTARKRSALVATA